MEHKPQEQIVSDIKIAKNHIEIGARYSHYKDSAKVYLVKDFGTLEVTDELCVIYQAEYDLKLVFVRPVNEWLENVEWQGSLVPRFIKIDS
jgi:hypothetical protein